MVPRRRTLASGLTFTFALPARYVTVQRLVSGRGNSGRVRDQDSVSYNIGRMLGPILVVVLLAPDHYGWAFIANGLSFIVFTTTLLRVRHGRAEPAGPLSGSGAGS